MRFFGSRAASSASQDLSQDDSKSSLVLRNLWNVHKFSQLRTREKKKAGSGVVRSPSFFSETAPHLLWYVELLPNGSDENKGGVSVYVGLIGPETAAIYTIALLDSAGNEVVVHKPSQPRLFTAKQDWGFDEFLSTSEVKQHREFLSDTVIIRCDLEFKTNSRSSKQPQSSSCFSDRRKDAWSIVDGLKGLGSNNEFSDISLYCGNQKFRTNKIVLAAHSTVFRDKLAKTGSTMTVPDIHPAVFSRLLEFMYTGACADLQKELKPTHIGDVFLLYEATRRFEIHGLASYIDDALLDSFSSETILPILLETFHRRHHSLQQDCLDYLRDANVDIRSLPGFDEVEDVPKLLDKVRMVLPSPCGTPTMGNSGGMEKTPVPTSSSCSEEKAGECASPSVFYTPLNLPARPQDKPVNIKGGTRVCTS